MTAWAPGRTFPPIDRRAAELAAAAARRDPETALAAIAELRARLDELERARVEEAILAGWSWSRVAGALGVTKQAAHGKHARRIGARRDARPPEAADRARLVVTGQARRSVASAREEAEALGQRSIGTEFLLLGLLRDAAGAAAHTLESLGVTLRAVRDQVERMLAEADGRGAAGPPGAPAQSLMVGSLPLSPRAQATLEQSLREAVRRGDRHLGGEHILLALLREPGGGAVAALTGLGRAPELVEARLEAALEQGSFAPATS